MEAHTCSEFSSSSQGRFTHEALVCPSAGSSNPHKGASKHPWPYDCLALALALPLHPHLASYLIDLFCTQYELLMMPHYISAFVS